MSKKKIDWYRHHLVFLWLFFILIYSTENKSLTESKRWRRTIKKKLKNSRSFNEKEKNVQAMRTKYCDFHFTRINLTKWRRQEQRKMRFLFSSTIFRKNKASDMGINELQFNFLPLMIRLRVCVLIQNWTCCWVTHSE